MTDPYVSIGLPVYNGERFLGRAIETLLAQEFTDFELVISDNASTDGTVPLVEKYADLDSRVRFEVQPHNRGASWNFNRVLAMAHPRARYMKWAAADDEHTPDYLRRTVAILDSDPTVALAHTGSADIDEDGYRLKVWHQSVEQLTAHDPAVRIRDLVTMRHECFQAFGLIRHDVVRQTQGLGPYADADNVLLMEIALRGRFVQDDAICFLRRQHSDRSMVAFADRRTRIQWFDPEAGDRMVLPFWRTGTEMVRAVQRAPLSTAQRRACYRSLEVFVRDNWPGLAKNVIRSATEAPGVLARRARQRGRNP